MPRFQFSLRTLLIVVTLLAIPCAYVGEQYRIVAHRRATRERLARLGVQFQTDATFEIAVFGHGATVPWIRELLGDEAIERILVPLSLEGTEDDGEGRSQFPEARFGYVLNW